LKLKIHILDRAFHKSNVVESDDFVIRWLSLSINRYQESGWAPSPELIHRLYQKFLPGSA
jgi:hypothetical protein